MSRYFKRVLSFVLSVLLIITVSLYYPLTTYALPKRLLDGTWVDVPLSEYGQELSYLLQYGINQIGAYTNGDFEGWLKNNDTYRDLYDDNGRLAQNVSIDTDAGNVTYSADLTALIKQALIEYSEETNGFYIVRTTPFSSIDPQQFKYKPQYTTLSTLVSQCKLIAVNKGSSSMMVASLSDVYDNGYSFVYPSSTIDTPRNAGFAYIYDSDWTRYTMPFYVFSFNQDTPAYASLSSGNLASELPSYRVYSFSSFSPNYCLVNHGSIYSQNTGTSFGACLVSNDGRNVRVFKNLDAFKLYTTNNRSVYFAKDFYESDPGGITATWDEIADSVANIDKSMQDLLDKIDSTTDENTIEDLLQQILDEIKGSGGGSGGNQGGSSGGGSYDDTGLLNTLSGYFSSVLAYLESILQAVEALVWIEADDTINADKKDLFDLIDRIWEDPENGSQEAADTISGSFLDVAKGITKKFPFSIPWDIHALFTVFANAGSPEPAAMAYPADPAVYYPGSGGIQAYTTDPEDLAQDARGAPYFVLPLAIESYGINENIVVDLKDFQTVSTLSRSLLAVLFAVFLIKFTISLMEMFKGGADG